LCNGVYSSDAQFCSRDGHRLQGPEAQVGAKIGAYTITALLGSGAYGAVYRAHHQQKDIDVALKILKAEAAAQGPLVARFAREAVAIQRMNHPNVVGVVDLGIHDRTMYIAMELVDGTTLEQAIARDIAFTDARTAAIAKQIALGLNEAHRLGFVHRDLKPSNVMLIGSPPSEQVKLLDFGVTGFLGPDDELRRVTATGYTVGTPIYMAPEQIHGGNVGPEADVYSLGAIIYHMLAGRPPFDGTLGAVISGHLTRPPPPIGRFGPLTELALRLLDKRPESRPKDVLEIVNQIALMYPSKHERNPLRRGDTEAPIEIGDDVEITMRELAARADSDEIEPTRPTVILHSGVEPTRTAAVATTVLVDTAELRELAILLEDVDPDDEPWLWQEYDNIVAAAPSAIGEGEQALLAFRVNSLRRRIEAYVNESAETRF
jgi:serine/threonine protein kinase